MPSRREFLAQTATAGVGLFAASTVEPKDAVPASKSLRILILGGTGFIGPHHVHAALKRGHRVSVFNRGKSASELPSEVEQLIGDRNGNLESIKHRDWDAVIDTAVYGPIWVRTLGQALKNRVRHYTFISSVGVYADPASNGDGTDEESQISVYEGADAYSLTKAENLTQYGQLKALCEREAEKQFPGKTLVVRPGTIVGPGDVGGVFTYWAMRMEAGGEVLVAGNPLSPVQLIDVRDIADWVIRRAETGTTGPFNLVGPELPLGWAEFLGALRGLSSSAVTLTWVPLEWVKAQGISSPLSPVLFWPAEVGFPGIMRMKNDKARAQGLTFRPMSVTTAETRAWFRSQPVMRQKQVLMGLDGKHSALEDLVAREKELLAAWHARPKSTQG